MRDIGLDESNLRRAHISQHRAYIDPSIPTTHTPPQLRQPIIPKLDRHAMLPYSLSININTHKLTFCISSPTVPKRHKGRHPTPPRPASIVPDTPDIHPIPSHILLLQHCPRLESNRIYLSTIKYSSLHMSNSLITQCLPRQRPTEIGR